ncbi:tetratricopeptide repeat protein [Pontibacter cellulosilyticus]|uniref:Tetratricopeptide repeat protein n=1 Tax=Pontibacter cellulosilyticus TaxID=1720253 RepID=A0A923N4K2_9BACT|nr:tetratricopeptide repeat protein [Pontibacter cellulosilyticus]MBC5991351.1 hypothetical protein [Pontibacter cellulosilyticus]
MRRLCKAFPVILLFLCTAFASLADGGVSEHEKLLQRAEQLLDKYKDSEALAVYEQILGVASENYVALCKASYLHCRISERYTDETKRLEHIAKAREYANKAYELNPLDAESNYVMALSLGSQALVSGPKERLVNINELKSFVDAALAADAKHAGSWHLLGRWYFKMANLNFAEKAASKFLFGGVCGLATNKDAADALEKAIAYNPKNIRYYYDLALIYDEMKDKEACITTLTKALTLTLDTKEELELSRRCKIMLQEKTNV